MTHLNRERLDPRDYDVAPDQGSFDRDLHHADRTAVAEALGALHPPARHWPILVGAVLLVAGLTVMTWCGWYPRGRWLAW